MHDDHLDAMCYLFRKENKMEIIKFKNHKAYETYKYLVDTCDSVHQCVFCPFFDDNGCVVQRDSIPAFWPQAELECDTCSVKNSCDEVTEVDVVDYIHSNMDAEMWKEVAEEKTKLIEELKKHIVNLDATICKQEAQLSESYDASNIKVRDDMIFSLEKQLSEARNDAAKWKNSCSRKNHYIAKLEGQITKAKEALKND